MALAQDVTCLTGVFGKIRQAGDFISRDLPHSLVRRWDGWLTLHLSDRFGQHDAWPRGGIRFRFDDGDTQKTWAGVILPSQDRAGRNFPLSLFCGFDVVPWPGAIDLWVEAVLPHAEAAIAGEIDAAALSVGLPSFEDVETGAASDPMTLWSSTTPPCGTAFDTPEAVLSDIFDAPALPDD